ncbi:MAG: bifunctional 3-phosphoshikimate 1-carboxyvinyltransferase/cytidylate kinase [Ottowia sp.]|nr:bifunctional 3-phosphoshikimate 1-carboxyvinyltransferase/cytidylate kinase [Ottowia sp.]
MYAIPYLDVPALQQVSGRVRLPGSKSISNRALLMAALCPQPTTIHGLLHSDDTQVMLAALAQLGCGLDVDGDRVRIHGGGLGARRAMQADLFLGNAGTAMRPLVAVLAILGGQYTLDGVPRMRERPIADLVDALLDFGCQVSWLGEPGFPPLRIATPRRGSQRRVAVRGSVSSQFVTALLIALPLAARDAAAGDIVVEISGELISRPYVDITLGLLARFGISVQNDQYRRLTIPAGSRYASPGELQVEPDASTASYFIAAATLSRPGKASPGLTIDGLDENAVQGDIRFVDAARQMGADIRSHAGSLHVQPARLPLQALDLDCNHIPDAAMTLAMMALFANGRSTLRNIASWRVKETDRLAAMAIELRKLGAAVEEGSDFLVITPPAADSWRAACLGTWDDHRMAMCGALAAFNPARRPVRIEDPACVAKTFPDFFETLFMLAEPAQDVPVICIDGPSASGKGTLASALAQVLGFHYLDSGALYRLAGVAARRRQIPISVDHAAAIAQLCQSLQPRFVGERVLLDGEDLGAAIRSEQAGMDASTLSAWPLVRTALLQTQRSAAQLPGLVTDGRDMGTVVFPRARLKVFLTASVAERARRRQGQLRARGIDAKIDQLRADLEARDARDRLRAASPLKPAGDALLLDNSDLSIAESKARVLDWWQQKQCLEPA